MNRMHGFIKHKLNWSLNNCYELFSSACYRTSEIFYQYFTNSENFQDFEVPDNTTVSFCFFCYQFATTVYRRDLITKNLFREIKDSKHPLHYLFPPLKFPIVKWFCCLHTHISFHLAQLLAVDVILYHTAFLRSLVCNFGVCYRVIRPKY